MTYIVLEGPKGCGKSTLYERLCREFKHRGVAFTPLCPTRPGEGALESLARVGVLSDWDTFRERLYAARSNFHARRARGSEVVMGDRSILTSYVTRWNGASAGHRRATLARVRRLEHEISLPDHVLYLHAPVALLRARIAARPRDYGHYDETVTRLTTVTAAYDDLRRYAPELGLSSIRWHELDATRPPDEVLADALATILPILSSPALEVLR
jgi:thymidylate kinase